MDNKFQIDILFRFEIIKLYVRSIDDFVNFEFSKLRKKFVTFLPRIEKHYEIF